MGRELLLTGVMFPYGLVYIHGIQPRMYSELCAILLMCLNYLVLK